MGDFAVMQDLPEMYRHCKSTEDKDMTMIDFFTDHLLNIDGVFDKHEKNDEQKPHQQLPGIHQSHISFCFLSVEKSKLIKAVIVRVKRTNNNDDFFHSDVITKIFRPPIEV